MPATSDVTVPLPASAFATVSVNGNLNVAVTLSAALIVTEQVAPDTVSHPVQPLNCEPDEATAVSVTDVPVEYGSEQSAPQSIPGGLDVMLPDPASALLTVNVLRNLSNVAATDREALIVTVHVAPDAPSHPVQPTNVDPL